MKNLIQFTACLCIYLAILAAIGCASQDLNTDGLVPAAKEVSRE